MTKTQESRFKYKHSEKGKAANKKYRQSAAGKAQQKRYSQTEKFKAFRMKYKKSEKGKEAAIRWKESIRGRMCSLLSSAKCRAKKWHFPCLITITDLLQKLHMLDYRCEVTGVKLNFSFRGGRRKNHRGPSLDQKIPRQGYTIDNTQIVTVWFNHLKGDMTNEETMSILNDWKNSTISQEKVETCSND